MSGAYWQQVHADGLAVPTDRPLDDLTAELTRMLGDPDPAKRDGTAYPTLMTWVDRGVYDDLLAGLGDGMAVGLGIGLGEQGTDTVFRRSFSALVLGECIARDNRRPLLPVDQLFTAGEPDRLAHATMAVLRRNVVPLRVLEPWIARLAASASTRASYDERDPYLAGGNAEAFLRSLYLQLSLGSQPPQMRSDLLLVVVDALKSSNAAFLRRTAE